MVVERACDRRSTQAKPPGDTFIGIGESEFEHALGEVYGDGGNGDIVRRSGRLLKRLGAMARPSKPPDLRADVTFLATDAGGKSKPVRSGYRASHDFGIEGVLNDAHHEYTGVELVPPGTTARAELWLLAPEYQVGRLSSGFRFTIQEGSRVVGHGVVVEVVNPALRHGA